MNERENIQAKGFQNVSRNGQIVGFQVRFRTSYYRGIWLSMSEGAEVTVDGEKFAGDQLTWTLGGHTYTQKEMENITDVQWPITEPALLTVTKPGGLKPGPHDVQVAHAWRASYMPPSFLPWRATYKRNITLIK